MITLHKYIDGIYVEITVTKEEYEKAREIALYNLGIDNAEDKDKYSYEIEEEIKEYFADEFMDAIGGDDGDYYGEINSWLNKRTGV